MSSLDRSQYKANLSMADVESWYGHAYPEYEEAQKKTFGNTIRSMFKKLRKKGVKTK